ncbi:MarR family transcriptional regulator [Embleya sp. NBC_00896]|uniref:MarR family winged helix-turn-helix transcriptional regulator n=1 Tax=Embleya sp. NBC_00896 TaxID=2975961 RepID=UPI002F91AC72|nr:MarR family transcriptional regulator [Embleya sp. NBC_00896]
MSDEHRLTSAESEIWRSYFTGTVEFAAHLDRRMRREAGMPMTYFEILTRLAEAPERRMRMTELATASQSSSSRLSHAVTALEKSGWVTRSPAECDRRGWIAHLTDAGFAALESAAPTHAATVRQHLFDVLTQSQVATLAEIGRAIQNGLSGVCASARAAAAAGELPEGEADDGASCPLAEGACDSTDG